MAEEPPRYNVLFIVSDQEYAHQAMPEGVSLPNHERLKAAGVTFENHQVTTTVCTPSRSVMLTGQHTPHTGMWDNTNMAWISEMDTAIPTVGHMLRDAGYYTAFKGKWHLSDIPSEGSKDALEPYGFADFQDWGETWGEPLDGYRQDPKVAEEEAVERVGGEVIAMKKTDVDEEKLLMTKYRPWLLTDGTSFRGALLEANGDKGIFILEQGKKHVELEFMKLSPSDLAFLTSVMGGVAQ